jgi:hypothetical protein
MIPFLFLARLRERSIVRKGRRSDAGDSDTNGYCRKALKWHLGNPSVVNFKSTVAPILVDMTALGLVTRLPRPALPDSQSTPAALVRDGAGKLRRREFQFAMAFGVEVWRPQECYFHGRFEIVSN